MNLWFQWSTKTILPFVYKKTNNIFLKINHSFLKMPKIVEIGEIFPAEKRAIQKRDQHLYKKVQATVSANF